MEKLILEIDLEWASERAVDCLSSDITNELDVSFNLCETNINHKEGIEIRKYESVNK